MITSLAIRNFQKHVKLDLELGPTTVITGETDQGKSAILRALIWVLTNEPSGDDFIHWDKPGVRVTITIDGHTITRKRGRTGVNTYSLDDTTYKAFGSSVPEPIAQVLKIGAINLQQQHDRSFWFHLSPAEVARQLNAIIDLSIIDDAQQKISLAVKRAKSEAEFTQERLHSAEHTLEELAYVPEFLTEVEAIEELDTRMRSVSVQGQRLRDLVASAVELRTVAKQKHELPDFTELDTLIAAGKNLRTAIDSLAGSIVTLSYLKIDENEAICAYTDAIKNHNRLTQGNCPLCGQPFPHEHP